MGVEPSLLPEVLILTNELDVAADWVVRELRRRGASFLRLNTERLTRWTVRIDPLAGAWSMSSRSKQVDLSGLRSVWYRRPEPPVLPESSSLDAGETALVVEQWQGILDGLAALPVRWLNDPTSARRAESKMLQLRAAAELGFLIPDTWVTNDAAQLRDLAATGAWVVKGLSAPLLRGPAGDTSFVFTEWLHADLLPEGGDVAEAPMIVQKAVWPKVDVRATVVGERCLTAATSVPSLDWRLSHATAEFEHHELPSEVSELCVGLVRALGLEFGAIDLMKTDEGQYLFLEINPNGEWGWLQKSLGLPIAEAIAEHLCA